MNTAEMERIKAEDQVVAELAFLGVRYLSQTNRPRVRTNRPPAELLAEVVAQPSSRVRTAVIPLLLARPEFQTFVPAAGARLNQPLLSLLEVLYTAAVFLQRKHAGLLVKLQGADFQELQDLYSISLGIPSDISPQDGLKRLGELHQELTGRSANWVGTYENAVRQWLRRLNLERIWNR
jgi:hypothetical protein